MKALKIVITRFVDGYGWALVEKGGLIRHESVGRTDTREKAENAARAFLKLVEKGIEGV